MHKFTPESFGAVHARRIAREIESYSLPERLALINGVYAELDKLADKISDRMAPTPQDPPDPQSSGSGTGTTSEPGAVSSDSPPGAEATSAPGEPGTVSPVGGPLESSPGATAAGEGGPS